MKRKIGYKVFTHIMFVVGVSVLCFTILNYNSVKNKLLDNQIINSKSQLRLLESHLSNKIHMFESDLNYLGKDLTYDTERDIYLIQSFKKAHNGIKSMYLFDSNKNLVGETGKSEYKELVSSQLNDMFFYEAITWDDIDSSEYNIYFKVTNEKVMYVAIVLDMEDYFAEITSDSVNDVNIINSFGHVIVKSLNANEQNISTLPIRNELLEGHSKTENYNEYFYSYSPLDVENIDLFVLTKTSNQEYKAENRQFIIRNVAIVLFLMTLSVLIAWKLVNRIDELFVSTVLKNNYEATEFNDIKEELNRAIDWIDDVVLHYDELNELKEDLIDLSSKIPEEGVSDERKNIKTTK